MEIETLHSVEITDDASQPALKYIRIDGGGYVLFPNEIGIYFPKGDGTYSAAELKNFFDMIREVEETEMQG